MAATRWLALAGLVATIGCARTDIDRGSTPPDDVGVEDVAADAPRTDAAPADVGRDVVADAGDPSCPWVPVTIGRVDASDSVARQPIVADGRVWVHRRDEGVRRAWAVEPATGDAEAITEDGVESALVDAAPGTVAWLQDEQIGAIRYGLRTRIDGQRIAGATGFFSASTDIALPATSRQAARGYVAVVDAEDGTIELITTSGTLRQTTADPVRFLTAGDGLVAWTEATEAGPSRLFAARVGDGTFAPIDLGEVSQFRPEIAVADGAVYAIGLDDSALRIDLDRGITRIDDGPCNLPVAGGGAVVFSCGESPFIGWFAAGDRLVWVRGDERDEVRAGGGRLLGGARVHSDAVVWVSYASLEDGEGLVEVWTPGLGTPPEPVAPAGAGCYTCGAYWPPPSLSIETGLAAWNYADPSPEPFDAPQAIGWAELQRSCR